MPNMQQSAGDPPTINPYKYSPLINGNLCYSKFIRYPKDNLDDIQLYGVYGHTTNI